MASFVWRPLRDDGEVVRSVKLQLNVVTPNRNVLRGDEEDVSCVEPRRSFESDSSEAIRSQEEGRIKGRRKKSEKESSAEWRMWRVCVSTNTRTTIFFCFAITTADLHLVVVVVVVGVVVLWCWGSRWEEAQV